MRLSEMCRSEKPIQILSPNVRRRLCSGLRPSSNNCRLARMAALSSALRCASALKRRRCLTSLTRPRSHSAAWPLVRSDASCSAFCDQGQLPRLGALKTYPSRKSMELNAAQMPAVKLDISLVAAGLYTRWTSRPWPHRYEL